MSAILNFDRVRLSRNKRHIDAQVVVVTPVSMIVAVCFLVSFGFGFSTKANAAKNSCGIDPIISVRYTGGLEAERLMAAKGDKWANYILAERYLTGRGVELDHRKSNRYARVAADLGHLEAKFLLGRLLYHKIFRNEGDTNDELVETAIGQFEVALAGGCIRACGYIGNLMRRQAGDKATGEVVRHWESCAIKGDAGSDYLLAETFSGPGEFADKFKANTHLRRAAAMSFDLALMDLAIKMLEQEIGGRDLAMSYLRQAANSNPAAAYKLALFKMRGDYNIERDYPGAVELARRSACARHEGGMYLMAGQYLTSWTGSPDPLMAINWVIAMQQASNDSSSSKQRYNTMRKSIVSDHHLSLQEVDKVGSSFPGLNEFLLEQCKDQ